MKALHFITALLSAGLCADAAAGDKSPAASTALPGVSVLGQKLPMPGLQRERGLRIYLPPSYASAADKRYPVIYMHDGQNLFDAATAYAGEWGVDEALDELARTQGFEAIVVGIDNGGELRMAELSPTVHARIGKAEGPQYLAFVVDVVKPLIDREYRSRPDRANTAIIGSSMGGLISHYAIQRYPDVFGKAGVFSPSYWVSPEMFARAAAQVLPADARVYLYAGGREGDMAADARRMHRTMAAGRPAPTNLALNIVASAQHNEAAWRAELPRALAWLFELPPPAVGKDSAPSNRLEAGRL
jgi:predicted alpha/beta superfamily hydrolase